MWLFRVSIFWRKREKTIGQTSTSDIKITKSLLVKTKRSKNPPSFDKLKVLLHSCINIQYLNRTRKIANTG